jgi:hypothetical protein
MTALTPRLSAALLVLLVVLACLGAREPSAPTATGPFAAAATTQTLFSLPERAAARGLHQPDHDDTTGPAPAADPLPPVGARRAEDRQATAFPPRASAPRWDPARAPPLRAS